MTRSTERTFRPDCGLCDHQTKQTKHTGKRSLPTFELGYTDVTVRFLSVNLFVFASVQSIVYIVWDGLKSHY